MYKWCGAMMQRGKWRHVHAYEYEYTCLTWQTCSLVEYNIHDDGYVNVAMINMVDTLCLQPLNDVRIYLLPLCYIGPVW